LVIAWLGWRKVKNRFFSRFLKDSLILAARYSNETLLADV